VNVKIRKGDTVEIISGQFEDKGKRGEVIRVLPGEAKVVVQGVNMRKKHQRKVEMQGRTLTPGIIKFEAPVSISNVMLVCPDCKAPTRVAVTRKEDGNAMRVCKQCKFEF
jgi:large subunit ribosomal protein L24